MDETDDSIGDTVGERLRAARESQQITLEAVAAQTRIPTRHLAALEASEWDSLPAPTYCVGFAKNYATVVGLDPREIAEQLRGEMGGTRASYAQAEVFQPADPKRTMPKWLILGAIVGVILVLALLSWMRQRDLTPADTAPTTSTATATPGTGPIMAAAPVVAAGQVTITAVESAWIEVRDRSGAILKQSQLNPGETFDVPASATAPLLKTGRPEALRITVGGREVPRVGPEGHSVSGVSLLAADLARGPAVPQTASATTATTSRGHVPSPAVQLASSPTNDSPASNAE